MKYRPRWKTHPPHQPFLNVRHPTVLWAKLCCHPTAFLSKKFPSGQLSYYIYQPETLAVLSRLIFWEDKILGRKITIITKHLSLEFVNNQRSMLLWQTRWYEDLLRLCHSTQYDKGPKNMVTDVLSRMYAGQNDGIPADI